MTVLPGVSIVIPNYNYARFLAAAIESGLAQDHPRTEDIVVDDGSTDDSRAVIASFADRIRAVHQPNQGHVAACTNGWRQADHDIIIFLDSDDMVRHDAASSVVRAWRPGVSKVQWCFTVVDAEDHELEHVFPKYPQPFERETVRRELMRVGNYQAARTSGNADARQSLERSEASDGGARMDGRLNPAAPLYGDVLTLHRPLTFYRVQAANDSAFGRLSPERLERQIELARWYREYVARCCAHLGMAFDARLALERNLWHRLMLTKLQAGGWKPAWPSLRAMLGATRVSTGPWWQRIAVATWATLVAAAPPSWARALIELRYEPIARPRWRRLLAERIGRRRRTRAGLQPCA
jgi:glycosyltransferase involved in cell wall biosynthesis